MRLAGYRIHGLDLGSQGEAYTYILAGNGLFLKAENPRLRARIPLAPAEVRGLPPLEPYLELRRGKIPAYLFSLAVNAASACPEREMATCIIWDGERYALRIPDQEAGGGHVEYRPIPGVVVDIHSHGRMGAFFSGTDDQDDQGFLVSLVIGKVDTIPEARARLCLYGYFAPVGAEEVFDGRPPEVRWNTGSGWEDMATP